MKRILSFALCLLLVASVFAGCGEDTTEPSTTAHKHSYSKQWAHDDTSHWYAADCGCDLKANLADHEDADKNGQCDVCDWMADCDHQFDTTWKSDENTHWHPAGCSHTGARGDEAAHVDENNDGCCDVCAYTGGHGHTFSEEWSYNDTQHWRAATCGHDVTEQMSLHADDDLDGQCDVCGWSDPNHSHTFSQQWQSNAIFHWHGATCEHTGAVADKAQHADSDSDDLCDDCAIEMCEHADYNDDGVCDKCGWYDPDHTHTYDQMHSDGSGHWYTASCHTGAKSEVEEHDDKNKDGICEICQFQICAHVYGEAWEMNETHHWHAVLCTCSIGKKDYAEHTLDESGACTVCMYGYVVPSVYEVVMDNEPFSFPMDKMLVYVEFTINFPQPGNYVLYPSLDGVKICQSNDGENVPTQSAITLEIAEAGEQTMYFRYFDFDYKNIDEVSFGLTLVRMDDVVVESLQGKVELPTNTVYKLVFHAPEIGSYNLITSVNNVVIGLNDVRNMEYYKGHIKFDVTEVGQEFIFYVELRDLSKASFIFDWILEPPFSLELGSEGNFAVNVDPKRIDYKINFTAPEAGYYKLSVTSDQLTFCHWSEQYNQPVRGNGDVLEMMEVQTGYLEAGQVFTTWLQAVYDYAEATNVFDTLTVSNIGQMIDVGENFLQANTEGAKYSFQSVGTSYYAISVENGEIGIISASGNVSWTKYYEVKVGYAYTYSFMVRGEGNEEGQVKVNIEAKEYAINLPEGDTTVTMVPAKEYDLTMLTESDLNRNVKLTWDFPGVIVYVNGEQYVAGTEVPLLNNTFSVMVFNQKDVDVTFHVEVTNPVEEKIEGDKDAILYTNQAAKLAIASQGDQATATFTAEFGGTYTFHCYTQGVNVFMLNADGTQQILFSNEGTYSFQLDAGESIIFGVSAIDSADTMSVSVMVAPQQ